MDINIIETVTHYNIETFWPYFNIINSTEIKNKWVNK